MIKTSRDIVVGQFYKAKNADGYYYVGIKFGDGKRLVCINMDNTDINMCGQNANPLFPNVRAMYREWGIEVCNQAEAMKAK